MNIPPSMSRLKGFRFPREIIAYAVWAYHRFAMSTADVEDLLAERGVIVSREAIRLWVNRFGPHFANCIRCDRPRPNDKWHLDEVVIPIARQETLALARHPRQWGRPRYSRTNATKRQGSKAVYSKADRSVRGAGGPDHR